MWDPGKFLVARMVAGCALEPDMVSGYVYRGLGLHMKLKGSPKGRRPPVWTLTHLGSGHRVADIKGKVADAFPIATEIAECADWDFDGLHGWRNSDPELPAKTMEIIERHSKRASRGEGGGSNEEIARQIALSRDEAPAT